MLCVQSITFIDLKSSNENSEKTRFSKENSVMKYSHSPYGEYNTTILKLYSYGFYFLDITLHYLLHQKSV